MLPEIILSIAGIVILIASIIFNGNASGKESDSYFSEEDLTAAKKAFDDYVNQSLERICDEAVVEADDTLGKISNEKMIALDEFSDVTLNKIREEHDHVVFLYKMITDKEDELKQSLLEIENAKKSAKETAADVIKLTRTLNSAIRKSQNISQQPGTAEHSSKNTKNTKTNQNHVKNGTIEDSRISTAAMVDEATGQMNLPEMMQADNKNEEILRMHKEGKSILEISKMLNRGQGEVKLVIDLYGG